MEGLILLDQLLTQLIQLLLQGLFFCSCAPAGEGGQCNQQHGRLFHRDTSLLFIILFIVQPMGLICSQRENQIRV
ncbi:hypothetical protein D3C85_1251880 [compost metagenome]